MLIVVAIAGAAALTVAAYSRLRARSPEAASAATRAVRELAAVVLVCTKAVEGVVDALQSEHRPRRAFSGHSWDDSSRGWDEDDYDRELRDDP